MSDVELYTPEGEKVVYRRLSARLPAFLDAFGPEKGYALETEIQDSLSLKPGLLKLYEVALQAGHKPDDLGLPSLTAAGLTQVCRATLRDATGRVVATATAAKLIQVYKDLEVLETAARQRLLAALGFGGEVFDTDEGDDQRAQGLQRRPAPARSEPAAIQDPEASLAREAEALLQEEIAHQAKRREVEPPAVAPMPAPAGTAGGAGATDALAMLQRQIAHQAKLRGLESPTVATKAEAHLALKALMATAV